MDIETRGIILSRQRTTNGNFHDIGKNGRDACHRVFSLNFRHKYNYFLKYFVSKHTILLKNHFIFFKETCFTFDYTLKYAVREIKLGHSQEAFPIFNSRKMCHHSGYPYINNQCSSLVDITYANYRCHEPERIDVSIGGSILAIFGLVHWMQMRHL